MDKKLYICRNCQYVFPKELSELIESKVQVYCEMCGTPFSISGVYFKQASVSESRKPIHRPTKHGLVDKERSGLDKAIKTLNYNFPLTLQTVACCCGHGKYPMTIVLKDLSGVVYELFSGIKIPRTRNFYKKDKQGIYYIPELVKSNV